MPAASKYIFSSALREVRFALCHTSQASAATRSFLLRAYPTMKKHNPNTPILIREAAGAAPKVWVRYPMGAETSFALDGKTESEIEAQVTELVKQEPAAQQS